MGTSVHEVAILEPISDTRPDFRCWRSHFSLCRVGLLCSQPETSPQHVFSDFCPHTPVPQSLLIGNCGAKTKQSACPPEEKHSRWACSESTNEDPPARRLAIPHCIGYTRHEFSVIDSLIPDLPTDTQTAGRPLSTLDRPWP